MKKLTSLEIRKMWLDFFKSKGHEIVPSAPLIPQDDDSLLWINAGVTPLKKYFDGNYLNNEEILSDKDIISYALILGFRKISGINKDEFLKRYKVDILDLYNIRDLIKSGLIVDNGSNLLISYDKIYVENSILINFVGE